MATTVPALHSWGLHCLQEMKQACMAKIRLFPSQSPPLLIPHNLMKPIFEEAYGNIMQAQSITSEDGITASY